MTHPLQSRMGLTSLEQSLVQSIAARRDELVATLTRWVAIPSQSGHASALNTMRGELRTKLAALGAECRDLPGVPAPAWLREGASPMLEPPPTLRARKWNPKHARRVLLCGHIDTVHDHRGSFRELAIDAAVNRATGPGCADMKGGLLVALTALEALAACGVDCSWGFLLNSDEETGSFHSDAALREEAVAGYAAGLVFEPALPDGSLVVERPGSGQFMIECVGKAAHVGRDFTKGISAVRALAEACSRTLDLADPARGLLVNIGPLEGGTATNIVPERARAWGNVRCFSDSALQAAVEGFRGVEQNQHRLPSTKLAWVFNRPPKPKTEQVDQLAHAARAAAEDLGQRLPYGTTGGVCDGNNLQAAGLPVIDTLGVLGGGLHTTNEWIDLTSLVSRAQLAAVLIHRLTQ